MSDIDNTEIVRLAALAAGQIDNHWQDRVVAAVPKIATLFAEPKDEHDPNSLLNVAAKVMRANTFTAEYRGHELDDKGRDGNQPTLRVFVRLYDEHNQGSDYLDADGCQTVRTEPVWSATGRHMRRLLDSLEVGQRVVCWRYSEQIGKTKKVGLLVHLEPLGRRRDSQGPPPGQPAGVRRPGRDQDPPSGSRSAGGEESAASPPARSSTPPSDDNAALTELGIRFEKLSPSQRVAYGRLCRGHGISDPMAPEPDQMAEAFKYLDQVTS